MFWCGFGKQFKNRSAARSAPTLWSASSMAAARFPGTLNEPDTRFLLLECVEFINSDPYALLLFHGLDLVVMPGTLCCNVTEGGGDAPRSDDLHVIALEDDRALLARRAFGGDVFKQTFWRFWDPAVLEHLAYRLEARTVSAVLSLSGGELRRFHYEALISLHEVFAAHLVFYPRLSFPDEGTGRMLGHYFSTPGLESLDEFDRDGRGVRARMDVLTRGVFHAAASFVLLRSSFSNWRTKSGPARFERKRSASSR